MVGSENTHGVDHDPEPTSTDRGIDLVDVVVGLPAERPFVGTAPADVVEPVEDKRTSNDAGYLGPVIARVVVGCGLFSLLGLPPLFDPCA